MLFNFLKGQPAQPKTAAMVHSSSDVMNELLQLQKEKQEQLRAIQAEQKKQQDLITAKQKEAKIKQDTMLAVMELQMSIEQAVAQMKADETTMQEADQLLVDRDAEVLKFISKIRNR